MNKRIKGLIEIISIAIIFLIFSYIIQINLEYFENLVSNDLIGMLVYVLIEIASIVIAPVTTLPLVAVASNLWGWVLTGILNVIGWMIGAWIAFLIARKYGILVVKKFISIGKVHEIEKRVPKEHLFWSVVLFRVIIPIDILSYALGIFTKMSMRSYLLATLIGMIPFAFAWAYFGVIKFEYQVMLFFIAGILILIGFLIKELIKKK